MSFKTGRARGNPCSYCAVPVLHPNQKCCLNCKNHPFDLIETEDSPIRESAAAPTPPMSPAQSCQAINVTRNVLAFDVRNMLDGTFVRLSSEDLKPEALTRYHEAGLLFEVSEGEEEDDDDDELHAEVYEPGLNTIKANCAIGVKLNGTAYGKTCLKEGEEFIVDRIDENMAGSIIIYQRDVFPIFFPIDYSISEDSVVYTKVTVKSDAKAWYVSDEGDLASWLFHERTLYKIEDGDEAESDFDAENEELHGVVFNENTVAQYVGPDDQHEDRAVVNYEGVIFSIKRRSLVVEVKVNENAYAQKLRASYNDREQFWFQFGDKVWLVGDDQIDDTRKIVIYDDEKFSIAKEYVG